MKLYPSFLLICSQCPVSFVAGMFQTDGQKLPGTMCDHQFISSNYSLTHGRFYSPRYPSSYPKNIKCAYRFRGRSARFSTIEIFSCPSPYLYDSNSLRNVFCNFRKSYLNLTFTIPKCLKYRNKGKDHNSQIQQHFIKFLKYISNSMG